VCYSSTFDLPAQPTASSLLGALGALLLLDDDDLLPRTVGLDVLDDVEVRVPNDSSATKPLYGRVSERRLLGRRSSTSALTLASGQTEEDESGVFGGGGGREGRWLLSEMWVARGVPVLPVNEERAKRSDPATTRSEAKGKRRTSSTTWSISRTMSRS